MTDVRGSAPPRASGDIAFTDGLERVVGESERLTTRLAELASDVRVTLAVGTLAGEPIQEQRGLLTIENYSAFRPRDDLVDRAMARADSVGLRVIKVGRFGITVSGDAALIAELSGAPLVVQAKQTMSKSTASQIFAENYEPPRPADLFLTPPTSLTVPAKFSEAIDHMVFTPPPLYFAPSASPPAYQFHGLAPADIARILNIPAGLDGSGVTVAMVDTGFYEHPYYDAGGFSYTPVPTPSRPSPTIDLNGHGTAMAFNVFATAPAVRLLGFPQSDPPQDAMEDAADANADIITCSWGWDREQIFPIFQATLLDIISEGRIVLFAAGNGHYAWPGSQPEVISVGGVYSDANGQHEASNYASGYMSSAFPGRRVPDVCGLCGQRPQAVYFMMPTQPGCEMDRDLATTFPDGDDTGPNDGWVGASGTSSATPQVAGLVALLVQRARAGGRLLTSQDVRAILEETARPIGQGRNAMGFPSVGHPNTATGWGLVDASAAIARV